MPSTDVKQAEKLNSGKDLVKQNDEGDVHGKEEGITPFLSPYHKRQWLRRSGVAFTLSIGHYVLVWFSFSFSLGCPYCYK